MSERVVSPWPSESATRQRIFRCAVPEVTERMATQFAAQFGVAVGRFGETRSAEAKVTYAAGQQEVSVYRGSGGVRYRDLSRFQVDSGLDLELADEEAVDRAQAFVEQHELAPMAECRLEKVTRLRVGLADREETVSEERVIDVGVVFRRIIDDLTADGPGGYVMVYIGPDGEVTGADRIWRPIAGVEREVEALSSREWLDERLYRFHNPDPEMSLDVEQIRFGYFEHGWRIRQEHIQPAYVVLATHRSPDERIRRRTVYVAPAATNHVGEIMPQTREVRRQPPRIQR